jgi:hypothetical protein
MPFDQDDQHYRRYRSEVERQLEADWQALRTTRTAPENAPLAPPDEGPVASLGRAVAEVFTAPESRGGDEIERRRLVRRELPDR